MIKEVVDDQIVRTFFFHIQIRFFVVLKKLCELFSGDAVFFWVQISDILWEDVLIQYEVNLSLTLRYIIKHQSIVALQIEISMRVHFQ